jgi:hypothetical protein
LTLVLIALPLLWLAWLVGLWANPVLAAWVPVCAAAVVGLGLSQLKVQDSSPIERLLRRLGWVFLWLALAEASWNLMFSGGVARLGDTVWSLLLYLMAAGVGSYANMGLFLYMRGLFGFSLGWLGFPLGVGVVFGVLSYPLGVAEVGYSSPDQLAVGLTAVLGMLGSFNVALALTLAFYTRGGSFCRWIGPGAVGFSLIVGSNLVYSGQGMAYTVGSLTDWLYLMGTSVFFVYLIWDERREIVLHPS